MAAEPSTIAADAVAGLIGCEPGMLVNPPYHDEPAIRTVLGVAGFRHIEIDRLVRSARVASARQAAIATVDGPLIRSVIESSAPGKLDAAMNAVERAIRGKLGDGQIIGPRGRS
jgi:hypothetical protein